MKKALSILFFWTLSFVILFRIFTKDYDNGTVDVIYTLLFHIPLIICVLVNTKLVDLFFLTKKYFFYFSSVVLLVFFGIALHKFIFDFLAVQIPIGYYFISMFSDFEIAQYVLAYILISLLIQLSLNWFNLRERQAELEKQNKEVQLQNLKSQLNPHFLFNSLNNIYALTDAGGSSPKEYIIKLSDSLRYMLYQTNDEKVKLTDEIEYLQNYIALEKLRLENDDQISFKTKIENEDIMIAPLILISLVENAFKHVDKSMPYIKITLEQSGNALELCCINSSQQEQKNSEEGGIGLENLKKRLDLIYPERYTYSSGIRENSYESKLSIQL